VTASVRSRSDCILAALLKDGLIALSWPLTWGADTLTIYDNGPVYVLHRGDAFNIQEFTDGINHAKGYGFDAGFTPSGWVYNGYFC
jgi:hypothetical protein